MTKDTKAQDATALKQNTEADADTEDIASEPAEDDTTAEDTTTDTEPAEDAEPEPADIDTDHESARDSLTHHGHAHPSGWAYIKIALILAGVTALEVFTYFRSVLDWGVFLVPALIFMMVVKFYLVATWFMHLRFDNKIYARLFTAGLTLAVVVYLITLAASEFWVK
ncbi:MAG: cytochrome C oxidase subunit IV family protein [Acidimicrobiaceae bacterium]|nr:cytochrome C oxidase subunit IV family protein [Acidimicrobiaceae bacterium]